MDKEVSIGIIGDFNPHKYASHKATNEALVHAADSLSLRPCIIWMPTDSFLTEDGLQKLDLFDSLWAASGSPYTSMAGALAAINRARLLDKPFLGTGGGFKHTLLEYARNVAGLHDASTTGEDPTTATSLMVTASCPVESKPDGTPRLWGGLKIKVTPGSTVYKIYNRLDIEESFSCNYQLNPVFKDILEASGLKFSGISVDGGVRIVELPGHRFFLATGFIPQYSSQPHLPHPLILSFLQAALEYKTSRYGS